MYIRREGKELLESSEIKKIAAVKHRLVDWRLLGEVPGSDRIRATISARYQHASGTSAVSLTRESKSRQRWCTAALIRPGLPADIQDARGPFIIAQ